MIRVIQICLNDGRVLCALCDDGTIWRLYPGDNWQLMPNVPQDNLYPAAPSATKEEGSYKSETRTGSYGANVPER